MFDEGASLRVQEGALRPELSLQAEYGRCINILNKTGIVSILPRSEQLGVLGIDGREYPVPTPDKISSFFERKSGLVKAKREQGFTRLQLTPLAVPLAILKARVGAAILKHAENGAIFQTKRNSSDPNIPVRVDRNEPLWMWDQYLIAEGSGDLVYFPHSYDRNHHGMSKEAVIDAKNICAIPGWSIGLIEDFPILPKTGETLAGRKQLETNHRPNDYLQTLQADFYKGETGWTPEDFLIHFLTRLQDSNQVSHDWDDSSALWLTGAYFPNSGGVPVGNWHRGHGRLNLRRFVPDDRRESLGARSTVRLGV